jgi:hypothetical protein
MVWVEQSRNRQALPTETKCVPHTEEELREDATEDTVALDMETDLSCLGLRRQLAVDCVACFF